tara:strand:- start:6795 stop:7487 length:693 start_codon:yes stop_codon:yes gene_type:complete
MHYLLELQSIDVQIDKHSDRLQEITTQLNEDKILRALQQRVLNLQTEISKKQTEQSEADHTLVKISSKILEAEKKLYGGTIVNSRELQDLQSDVAMLKGHQNEAEDTLLLILDEIEQLEKSKDSFDEKLISLKSKWGETQEALLGEKSHLEDEVSKFIASRDSTASSISNIEISIYEQVRKMHRGSPVARMEHNLCNLCKIGLPMKLQQEIRDSNSLHRCPNCGRILVNN